MYNIDLTPRRPGPGVENYARLLDFVDCLARDLLDLKPCDRIDIQLFLWVQGSDECEE